MEFKKLRLSDKNLFEEFLDSDKYNLSTYHFCNIFIWKDFFEIFYTILDGYLCLFFKDKQGCFMYLPPLGREPIPSVINTCFAIMDKLSINKDISRIENVEKKDFALYQDYGYTYYAKPGDYLYKREDIAFLRGIKFKSKRSSYNYFIKHYDFGFRPFLRQDTEACLDLYQRWSQQRKDKFPDLLYQSMLQDSFRCQKVAMENFFHLDLIGYMIKIKDKITGYIFGFPINSRIFCILFEICDLFYRGISQFIFSQFCRQISDYQYINVMDDSGLENLRRVKLSYHPACIVPNYIIKKVYD